MNSTKIENLGAPASANDAARLADIQSAVEGIAWKDSVRIATSANINLASPSGTIDGVVLSNGDRVLVKAQTSTLENGIYVFNGAGVPMSRALDASTAAELEQAITTVEEGTSAGTSWRQTSVNFVLETDAVAFSQFGSGASAASETSSGIAEIATQTETDTGTDDARFITPLKLATWSNRAKRASGNIGDNSATQFDLSHNFATRDVQVEVYRNAAPYDSILCDVARPDANTVRLNFAVAPTTNQFRVVVFA